MDKELLPIALALGWHSVDAVLHMNRPHKRVRMMWAGVGIGWSLFWLIKKTAKKTTSTGKGWVVIKEWSILSD